MKLFKTSLGSMIIIFITSVLMDCAGIKSTSHIEKECRLSLTDHHATKETVALYYNLKKISGSKILFGQQDATSSGYGWNDTTGRCDIKEVCGSNPAFYSWDFMDFTQTNTDNSFAEKKIRHLTEAAYNRGGVNSYCWHFCNPVTNKSFYDTTITVKYILPGGSYHKVYTDKLKLIANYANTLRGKKNELIPVIFRPFHEFDGNWFWWGQRFCTKEEFMQLYRFTIIYLRDSLHVHNFIYAFSPDCNYQTESKYLERYPGDSYVDIIGTDNYFNFRKDEVNLDNAYLKLKIISDYAIKTNKVAALTETGQRLITDSLWFTQKLLKVVKNYPNPPKLAYMAVWRNNINEYWTPPPGHPAVNDFIKFTKDTFVIMENTLPSMYKIN